MKIVFFICTQSSTKKFEQSVLNLILDARFSKIDIALSPRYIFFVHYYLLNQCHINKCLKKNPLKQKHSIVICTLMIPWRVIYVAQSAKIEIPN